MKLKIVLVVIMAICISIFLHEMGHYFAFTRNGIEVEKISVGAVWKLKLAVFTDSRGTEYEIGPLPLWGYTQTQYQETGTSMNLAKEAEIYLAGVAVNALIVLLLTPWYFLLRRRWRKRGANFTASFPGKIFRVFIVLNILLFIFNTLWLASFTDGGRLVYFILNQRFGKTAAGVISFGLSIGSLCYLFFYEVDRILGIMNKIYGWSSWPGSKKKKD